DPGERQHFRRLARCVEVLVRLRTIGIGNGSRNVGRHGTGGCSLLRQGGRGIGKQRGGRNGGKKGNGPFHVLLPVCHQVTTTLLHAVYQHDLFVATRQRGSPTHRSRVAAGTTQHPLALASTRARVRGRAVGRYRKML